MTRTLRAYNKRPILGGPGLKGWIVSNRYDPYVIDVAHDFVYRRYGYYCMGNCPSCKRRDKRDQWRRTARKEEERMVSWFESDSYYFMWDWDFRDVLDGLFGEHEAERMLQELS